MRTLIKLVAAFVFLGLFAAAAAAVLLKTAGYTYNFKKGALEKTGILVIKSKPAGARVAINGTFVHKTTPLRIRNLRPNNYDVRVEKTGFHQWSSELGVSSGLVTFAEHLRLFPIATPNIITTGTVRAAALSRDGRYLAWTDDRAMFLTTTRELTTVSVKQFSSPPREVSLSWSPDALHLLLIEERAAAGPSATVFLLPPNGPIVPITDILGRPADELYWSTEDPKTIESAIGRERITIDPVSRRILQKKLTADGSASNVMSGPRRGSWLPSIDKSRGTLLIAHDGESADTQNLKADEYFWSPDPGDTRLLVPSGSELWLIGLRVADARPIFDATLLARIGAGIDAAAWSADAAQVFYSTGGKIMALDLEDYGSGRHATELAGFESVSNVFSPRDGQSLFIIGTQQEKDGIYRLPLE